MRIAFRNVMATIEAGKHVYYAFPLRLPSHDGLKTYPATPQLPCRPAGRITSRGLYSAVTSESFSAEVKSETMATTGREIRAIRQK